MIIKTAISLALFAVVIAILAVSTDPVVLWRTVIGLSATAVISMVVALTAGTLLASVRLKLMARDFGYHLTWRDSLAALSASQLAAGVFFQVVGQLIARGVLLSRVNVPVSATIVLTAYERFAALLVSVVLAAAGAFHIFGKLTLNLQSGGHFIKLAAGLLLAVGFGAAIGWGPRAAKLVSGMGPASIASIASAVVLSLGIQLTTMAAYVIAAKTLQPAVGIADLCAASAIIMLAASLPISLAGWGIRELSAIVALGAVGVGTEAAFTVAVLVGGVSLVITAALAFASAPNSLGGKAAVSQHAPQLNFAAVLDWVLPLAAATAVFFQVFVPLRGGVVNVNLADPIVMIGGALFILRHLRKSSPQWRLPGLNLQIALTTMVVVLAFLHGLWSFGMTEWAFANKLVGWFILLAYGAVGASLVLRGGDDALQMLLLTFAAVAAAIVTLETVLVTLLYCGVPIAPEIILRPIEGFSQNRNSFSFLLLLAFSIVLLSRTRYSIALGTVILVGLWLAGSRAALGTLIPLIAMALFLRIATLRAIATMIVLATLSCAMIIAISFVRPLAGGEIDVFLMPVTIDVPGSQVERLKSILDGFAMFLAHPIFGAGLGAYMHEQIGKGSPLIIHSTPLWIAAEMGAIGLGIFVWTAARIFRAAWRWRNTAGGLLVLMLVAFAVMSSAHELLYQRALWLLLGAALALPAVQPAEESPGATA